MPEIGFPRKTKKSRTEAGEVEVGLHVDIEHLLVELVLFAEILTNLLKVKRII
jgi:hypothetical protein